MQKRLRPELVPEVRRTWRLMLILAVLCPPTLYFGPSLPVWARADARLAGRELPWGQAMYFLTPLVLPVYLVEAYGWRGAIYAALWFAPVCCYAGCLTVSGH